MKKTVLVAVTGGIAAYKTRTLVESLTKRGFDVRVIMTKSACAMISPDTFQKASGNPVYTDLFTPSFQYKTILKNRTVDHIQLANSACLMVIVPATANVIAKLAVGIADDYVTTTALAVTCPILIAPSMNVYMWKNPMTQKNIQTVRHAGMHIIEPATGMLACGYEGKGRLADVKAIEQEILRFGRRSDELKGKRIIVTSGGTIEPIDGVRVITNRSSGKMGIAIAEACFLCGADVVLMRSQTSVEPRFGMKEYVFDTADSLQQFLKTHAPGADICIHAAAVSDFAVKNPRVGKITSEKPLPLELTPRTKILDQIKTYNPHIFLVAFKAEWGIRDSELVTLASKRLSKSGADLIVANDVGREGIGFQSDENEVVVIPKKGKPIYIPKNSKTIIAEKIMDIVKELVTGREKE